MPGRPSRKVFCQSMTRRSNYTVQCRAKGHLMKSGYYRCKNHGGYSTGPTSEDGKLKALRNLVSMKNKTDDEIRKMAPTKKAKVISSLRAAPIPRWMGFSSKERKRLTQMRHWDNEFESLPDALWIFSLPPP